MIADEKIAEVIEFESQDPRFAGEMTLTTSLADTDRGTEITLLCEDIPAGTRLDDDRVGTEQALERLARLLTG